MLMQYKTSNFKNSVFSLTCLLTLAYPSVSKAGFEWTPPVRIAPAVEQAPQVNPEPPAGPLTPELSSEHDSNLPVPVGNVEQAPIQEPIAEAPAVSEAPVEETKTPAEVKTEVSAAPVIEGFGKDIPLAIALRDIVPPNYAYVFSPRDIAGTKISWRGGKPWLEVLQNALSQQNLDATINGNNITIFSKQAELVPVQTPTATVAVSDPLPLVEPVSQPPVDETAIKEEKEQSIPVVDLKRHNKWTARPGTTLRQTLESWSKSSGTEVNWSTPYDYPINNAFYFEGNFSEAVESLLSSYGGESPAPKGRLYPNLPDGPSVLMIN
jgi:type IV pili sensor histidine kinase/response regulator